MSRQVEKFDTLPETEEPPDFLHFLWRSSILFLFIHLRALRSDQIIEFVSQSDRPNRGIPLLMQLVFEKAILRDTGNDNDNLQP